jgi:hypothetical protein
LPFESWGRFLPEDTTAVALLDRLLNHATTAVTSGRPGPMADSGDGPWRWRAYGAAVLDPWARAVAAEGAIVFVPYHYGEPTWPTAAAAVAGAGETTEQLACAVCFARSRADRYGGDPADLSLFGHSSGAHSAALIVLTDPAVSPHCLGS